MDLEGLNLDQICRTCKCMTPQMRSIFEGYENPHESPRIDEMLMACASVLVIYGDGLPTQICQLCVEQLKHAFIFKRQCEKVDVSLREYTKYVKVNEIKEEPQNYEFIDQLNVDNYKKSQVKMTEENMCEEKIKEVTDFTHHDEERNLSEAVVIGAGYNESKDNDSSEEKGANEDLVNEEMKIKVEVKEENVFLDFKDEYDDILGENNEVADEDSDGSKDSNDSEYRPIKSMSPKIRRRRGRPRKNPDSPPKVSVPGRARGRPPTKVENEECSEFPCPACQEVYITMSQLDRHARLKHKGLKVHRCKECNKGFKTANVLKRHAASHSLVKPFHCTVCTKSFNRSDHRDQHQKLHDKRDEYYCFICEESFNLLSQLSNHKASKHGIGAKIMDEKKYECPVCHKRFTSEKYKDLHVNGHGGQRKYVCNICKKRFLTKSNLTEHMKSHNNENNKKFLCSECGERFIRKDYLLIHMLRHRGEKPFKCKYCGKGFTRSSDLTVHERFHTGEKTHFCTICGKAFGRPYKLTVHMRTHTGEKPYKCTYCDAAFAQSNDLKVHTRTHTGERFQCDLCTKSFLAGHLLTRHRRKVHGLVSSQTGKSG